MDCGAHLFKYILFFGNFLIVGCGIFLICLGYNNDKAVEVLVTLFPGSTILNYSSQTLMALGIIITIVAVLGCYGAISESTCMLISYTLFFMTMVVIQGVLVYLAWRLNSDGSLKSTMQDQVKKLVNDGKTGRQTMDLIQSTFDCCGVDSYKDYENCQNPKYPQLLGSCCTSWAKNSTTACSDNSTDLRKSGCYGKVETFLANRNWVIVAIVIQALNIVMPLYLVSSINRSRRFA